jgi:hypothetical protein
MIMLYDDRCRQVIKNTGEVVYPLSAEHKKTLTELLGLAEMEELSGYQGSDRTVPALKAALGIR